MQQRLKPASRAARAEIVAAELLAQFLVAVDEAQALLNRPLGIEIPSGACSWAQKQNVGSKRSLVMAPSHGLRVNPGFPGGAVYSAASPHATRPHFAGAVASIATACSPAAISRDSAA